MKCHLHPDRDAVGYCTTCGTGVCAECRREVLGTIRCPAHATAPVPVAPRPTKSGFLSGFFSLMFPGLGHLYLGVYQRGLKFGGIAVALIVVLSMEPGRMSVLFGVSLFFLYAFAFFDALHVCHQINEGTWGGSSLMPLESRQLARAKSGSATLTWGVILFGIGCLFVADRYLDLDRFFDWTRDNIGFVFLALGAVLLVAYARRRNREKDRELENSASSLSPVPSDSTDRNTFVK